MPTLAMLCILTLKTIQPLLPLLEAFLGRAKPNLNRFGIFRFCAIDLTNLKSVWRIRSNRFGDGLFERTKMSQYLIMFLISTI